MKKFILLSTAAILAVISLKRKIFKKGAGFSIKIEDPTQQKIDYIKEIFIKIINDTYNIDDEQPILYESDTLSWNGITKYSLVMVYENDVFKFEKTFNNQFNIYSDLPSNIQHLFVKPKSDPKYFSINFNEETYKEIDITDKSYIEEIDNLTVTDKINMLFLHYPKLMTSTNIDYTEKVLENVDIVHKNNVLLGDLKVHNLLFDNNNVYFNDFESTSWIVPKDFLKYYINYKKRNGYSKNVDDENIYIISKLFEDEKKQFKKKLTEINKRNQKTL
jgi:serine/threonine protein kinase